MIPLMPLKHVADVRFSSVDKKTVDGQIAVKLCNYTDVYYNEQIVADMPFMEASATADQVATFSLRAGDVLLTKDSETADDIGVSAHVPEDLPGVLCGYHLAIARPRPSAVDGRYMRWALAATASRQQLEVSATGVTRFGLRQDAVAGMLVPVPSLLEQRAIADYLDAETARIDEVISAYRRELTLVASRKRATASEALARHSTDTVPVRRVVTKVTSGPRGWSGLEVEVSDQLFLRIANVPADSIDLKMDDVAYINAPGGDESERCRVRPGDVLTTITAAIGQVAVVPRELGEAYISQHLALLRPNRALVSPEWLALALWSEDSQRQLDAARYGGTKQQLSLDDVREIRVPLADLTIQQDVANRIVASLDALTRAEHVIRRLADLLLERRQALITAAVTGQLEIPGVAA